MSKLAPIAVLCLMPLPWKLRRLLLQAIFGYRIHKTAHISRFAMMLPAHLEMGPRSFIGPLTLCKGLELVRIEEHGFIGALNWITGFPLNTPSRHFELDPERRPQLILEAHAAITSRHLIDCTDAVRLGAFSTLAGFRSQILTHSVDLDESRQRCKPVLIGRYCFVGTGCVLLGGSLLPDHSVLGANSMLAVPLEKPGYLYAGVPARPVRAMDPEAKYFSRAAGFVV